MSDPKETVASKLEELAKEVRKGSIDGFEIHWDRPDRIVFTFKVPNIKRQVLMEVQLLPRVVTNVTAVDASKKR